MSRTITVAVEVELADEAVPGAVAEQVFNLVASDPTDVACGVEVVLNYGWQEGGLGPGWWL